MKKTVLFLSLIVISVPIVVGAQGLVDVLLKIGQLISIVIPITVALALLFFVWGLAKYKSYLGDHTKNG